MIGTCHLCEKTIHHPYNGDALWEGRYFVCRSCGLRLLPLIGIADYWERVPANYDSTIVAINDDTRLAAAEKVRTMEICPQCGESHKESI